MTHLTQALIKALDEALARVGDFGRVELVINAGQIRINDTRSRIFTSEEQQTTGLEDAA